MQLAEMHTRAPCAVASAHACCKEVEGTRAMLKAMDAFSAASLSRS